MKTLGHLFYQGKDRNGDDYWAGAITSSLGPDVQVLVLKNPAKESAKDIDYVIYLPDTNGKPRTPYHRFGAWKPQKAGGVQDPYLP